jgi:hypothetical protein
MRYASCCTHVRALAVIGCTTTTYVKEDMTMKWVVGRSKWGRCEHVHDPGHAATVCAGVSGQARGASEYEHLA